jgi:hypothetical protein
MLDIPLDLLGLIALIAGGVAWIVAGLTNDTLGAYLTLRFTPKEVSRIKAFISLLWLIVFALLGFAALNAIRNTAGTETGFFAMLIASFASQKAFFMTTDSLIGFNKPASVSDSQGVK